MNTSDGQRRGRTVLVTGVGRRQGIGFAVTRRLLQGERARVLAQSCDAYDVSEPDRPCAITPTLPDSLIDRGITVNTINPGPTDTGWASADLDEFVSRHMPRGRWNSPEEAAAVVAMLLSPDSGSITGQVIGAEGGFRRFTP